MSAKATTFLTPNLVAPEIGGPFAPALSMAMISSSVSGTKRHN